MARPTPSAHSSRIARSRRPICRPRSSHHLGVDYTREYWDEFQQIAAKAQHGPRHQRPGLAAVAGSRPFRPRRAKISRLAANISPESFPPIEAARRTPWNSGSDRCVFPAPEGRCFRRSIAGARVGRRARRRVRGNCRRTGNRGARRSRLTRSQANGKVVGRGLQSHLPWVSAGQRYLPRHAAERARIFSMATLEVCTDPNGRQFFELTSDEMVVGRDQFCDIVLRNHTVSRQHARIVRSADGYLHRRPVEPQRHLPQRPPAGRPHADQGPGSDPHLRSRDRVSRRHRPPERSRAADEEPGAHETVADDGGSGRASPRRRAAVLVAQAPPSDEPAEISSQARFRAALKISLESGGRARRRRNPAQDPRQPVRDFSAGRRAATSCWPKGPTGTWCRGPSSIARARPGHSMTFGPISRKTALHVMSTGEAILMDDGAATPADMNQSVFEHAMPVDDLRAVDGSLAPAAGHPVSRHDRSAQRASCRTISTCWWPWPRSPARKSKRPARGESPEDGTHFQRAPGHRQAGAAAVSAAAPPAGGRLSVLRLLSAGR